MDNIDRSLLLAFVKYILLQIYSHFFELYSRILSEDCVNCCFLKKTFLKSSIYFGHSKNGNFHNSGMVGRWKLPDSSMNNIFGLKCCVTITPKGQSLKFKASVLYEIFPFLKQAGIVILFLNLLIVTELLVWNRKIKI